MRPFNKINALMVQKVSAKSLNPFSNSSRNLFNNTTAAWLPKRLAIAKR
jgi:hypothetical protein